MNGYVCFYNGTRLEVRAETTYAAQQAAQVEFQKKFRRRNVRSWEIDVTLAERGDEQVTHTAVD